MNDLVREQSARELAEEEFAEEQKKRDVSRFKELYRSLDKARKVVKAIEAEIADLEDELG